MENNTNKLNPMLCKSNCGFFGNASCDGYCSKCYKDHVKRQNSGSAAGRVTPTTSSTQSHHNEIPVNAPSQETTPVEASQEQAGATAAPVQSSSFTAPIPIPSRQQSVAAEQSGQDNIAMSMPGDLISRSLLSTSSSPMVSSIDDSANNSLSTSINSENKKKRNRCVLESCKRKVGLTGFDCRCGGLFCWEHRYSDKHNCKFDYKELGQDQIRKNNPIVIGEKIQKI